MAAERTCENGTKSLIFLKNRSEIRICPHRWRSAPASSRLTPACSVRRDVPATSRYARGSATNPRLSRRRR